MNVGRCRSCGGDVVWTVTETQRLMPVDAEPDDAGNLILEGADGIRPRSRAALPGEAGDRYISHFATCPHAEQWRGR